MNKLPLLLLLYATSFSCMYSQTDTTLIRILHSDNDSTLFYDLSDKIDYLQRTDIELATKYTMIHDSLSSELGNPIYIAQSKYQLGNIHYIKNQYDQAIDYLTTAAQLYEKNDPTNTKLGGINNTIAAIFTARENYSDAIEYYDKALNLFKTAGDSTWIGITLLNSAVPHISLKEYAIAKEKLLESDVIFERKNLTPYRGYTSLNLADTYQSDGDHKTAKIYAEKAMAFMPMTSDPTIHSGAHLILSKAFAAAGSYSKSIDLSKKGLEIARKTNFTLHIQEGSEIIYQAYEAIGQLDKAYPYLMEYSVLKDSLNKKEADERMLQTIKSFEFEKKEKEIETLTLEQQLSDVKLSQQKGIIWIGAGSLVLLSFLLWRLSKQKGEIDSQKEIISKALDDKTILLQEIHHRVKNNLQVISSLLGLQSRSITDEQAKEAIQESRSRVHSMSLIHQNLYKKENVTGVNMKDYLTKLTTSLFHTYNLSDNRIKLITDIDALTLDVESVVPIGLIVNELISNSLKYAFPENRSGSIEVRLKDQDDKLLLSVIDDGVGLDSNQLKVKNESFGHSLIRAFKNKLNAIIDINSQNGTSISLSINSFKRI